MGLVEYRQEKSAVASVLSTCQVAAATQNCAAIAGEHRGSGLGTLPGAGRDRVPHGRCHPAITPVVGGARHRAQALRARRSAAGDEPDQPGAGVAPAPARLPCKAAVPGGARRLGRQLALDPAHDARPGAPSACATPTNSTSTGRRHALGSTPWRNAAERPRSPLERYDQRLAAGSTPGSRSSPTRTSDLRRLLGAVLLIAPRPRP